MGGALPLVMPGSKALILGTRQPQNGLRSLRNRDRDANGVLLRELPPD